MGGVFWPLLSSNKGRMPKLIVAFPFSGRYVPPEWALAISGWKFPQNTSCDLVMIKGVKRDVARNTLAKKAVASGAEYMLFLDDDTAPPPNTITALMAHLDTSDEDVAVCGGIYTTKSDPVEPLVYKGPGMGPFWRWKFGEVFPCWGIGTGCMMIRLSSLSKIPEPWFRDIPTAKDVDDSVKNLYDGDLTETFCMGDDLYFCNKLAQAGLKVHAHGGVLPVHWDQEGKGFVLPYGSYPLKDVPLDRLWYSNHIKQG